MKLKKSLLGLALIGLSSSAWSVTTSISPSNYSDTIEPGNSVTINKDVIIPEVTPKLDLFLLIDGSGSYDDDIQNIKLLGPDLVNGIRASVSDSNFGIGLFTDYYCPVLGPGEYLSCSLFQLVQPLTDDENIFLSTLDNLYAPGGADEPSVLATYAATGAGWDENNDGDYEDFGDVPPQRVRWRADATKVIALSTDEPIQVYGSLDIPTLENHLINNNFKLILLKAPGMDNALDSVALATGGAILNIQSDSSDIVSAILSGIEQLTFTITANPVGCEPLNITFSPSEYTDVSGGEIVSFEETIEVPEGTPPGTYECDVEFYADDTLIGSQHLSITVPQPKTDNYITGGGYTKDSNVKLAGRLFCNTEDKSSLILRWKARQFVLRDVTSVNCDSGPFTTNCGMGVGTYFGRGIKTVNIEWCITDNGTPGRNKDTVEIRIWDDERTYLDTTDVLRRGDFKAVEVELDGGSGRGGIGDLLPF